MSAGGERNTGSGQTGHRRHRCHVPASGLQQRCIVGIDPEVLKCWIEEFGIGGRGVVKVLEWTNWTAASIQVYQQLQTTGAKHWRPFTHFVYIIMYLVVMDHRGIKSRYSYNKGEQLDFLTVYQYVITVVWNALFLTQWLAIRYGSPLYQWKSYMTLSMSYLVCFVFVIKGLICDSLDLRKNKCCGVQN